MASQALNKLVLLLPPAVALIIPLSPLMLQAVSNFVSFWSMPRVRTPHLSPLWLCICCSLPPRTLCSQAPSLSACILLNLRVLVSMSLPGPSSPLACTQWGLSSLGIQHSPYTALFISPCDTVPCFLFRLLTPGRLQLKSGLILRTLQHDLPLLLC